MSLKVIIRNANNTSGELGANAQLRLVVLSGTASFNQTFGDVSNLQPTIKTWLEDNGFSVAAVRTNKQALFGNTVNIELELNAYDNYTAEQVRQSAMNVLSSIQRFWITGYYNVLASVNLRVVQDYKTTTTAKQSSFPSPTPAQSNSGNSSVGNLQNPFPDLSALNPMNLFGTAGLSVGLVAAVLIGIIILKR